MTSTRRFPVLPAVLASALVALAAGCGGGANIPSGDGSSVFVLLGFSASGQDNVPLNGTLRFQFSGAVDPATVTSLSLQIREGGAFGETIPGSWQVSGSVVTFEPQLPGLCDLSDSALQPATTYRVTVVGYPEAFAIRSASGLVLDRTSTHEFTTRTELDPALFEDQIPGAGPVVLSTTPQNGSPCVAVTTADEALIVVNENLDPCTIGEATVLVYEYERGDPATFQPAPNLRNSGFVTPTPSGVDDAAPADPYTWGATNAIQLVDPPQKIRAAIVLEQTFDGTLIRVRPESGRWPDDALVVVELTFGIQDLGGLPLVPHVFSFTTENLPVQVGLREILWEGETPVDDGGTTADVDTARAVSKAQGYMLFAGDGDNGGLMTSPSLPQTPASLCTIDRQGNDGVKDEFDPTLDVLLDTGSSANTCVNQTDGSTAVIWEFNSFRVRQGRTVRIVGRNPAIILVQGDVLIESGGKILVRGDNQGGSPDGRGANGAVSTSGSTLPATNGGVGVAGGGAGGRGMPSSGAAAWTPSDYGEDGTAGFGSPSAGTPGGLGGGQGNVRATMSTFTAGSTSGGGGGGGHAVAGSNGSSTIAGITVFPAPARGAGGGVYPTGASADAMQTPSAGSGGGGAGGMDQTQSSFDDASGGAGGAGGGFVDFTSSGDIFVFGTIDAAGSRGGNGAASFYSGSGGGGGGSGGGIRLLTPNDINLSGGTVTTAGGGAGTAGVPTVAGSVGNNGGSGGSGRLVLEDGDSVISGVSTAQLTPSEGNAGFFRSVFNAGRFQGGGLTPQVLTELFYSGATSPDYQAPAAGDFPVVAGRPGVAIPAISSRGPGATGILIEARAYPILPDGDADTGSPTAWYTVGYHSDSGQEDLPTWVPSAFPADVGPRPADNAGDGIDNLDGFAFLELRITFYLPNTVGPFDPGPYVDTWQIRYAFDQ